MAKTKKQPQKIVAEKQRFEVLLEEIQSEVHVIAEQSAAHTKRFDAIDNQFDKHDSRLEKVEVKLTNVEIQLTKVETRLTKIEEDIAVIKID